MTTVIESLPITFDPSSPEDRAGVALCVRHHLPDEVLDAIGPIECALLEPDERTIMARFTGTCQEHGGAGTLDVIWRGPMVSGDGGVTWWSGGRLLDLGPRERVERC